MDKQCKRCPWVIEKDELYIKYHDQEWGVPVFDDRKIFEFLVLESFQAGLSWRTILNKRENFRKAFANFDYNKVAHFTLHDQKRLVCDVGIVRNRAKIQAAVINAQCFLKVRSEFGTFAKYMWSFVGGKPVIHRFKTLKDYVATSDAAIIWAKDLKARGFKFLGATVVYAHMQAVGMVNDHLVDCFRYRQLGKEKINKLF